ncbi:hypothetical protein ABVK25_009820 [Lepraria finkii]|uniref:Uncharacterized protein n=1 Tax=Lepraria finkii TaxID=1340010 RepID=A0ABR4AXU5_9LECA
MKNVDLLGFCPAIAMRNAVEAFVRSSHVINPERRGCGAVSGCSCEAISPLWQKGRFCPSMDRPNTYLFLVVTKARVANPFSRGWFNRKADVALTKMVRSVLRGEGAKVGRV